MFSIAIIFRTTNPQLITTTIHFISFHIIFHCVLHSYIYLDMYCTRYLHLQPYCTLLILSKHLPIIPLHKFKRKMHFELHILMLGIFSVSLFHTYRVSSSSIVLPGNIQFKFIAKQYMLQWCTRNSTTI